MMNALAQQHLTIICESGEHMNIEQLKTSLNVFDSALHRSDTCVVDIELIKFIVASLLNLSGKSRKLAEPELIAHPFYVSS